MPKLGIGASLPRSGIVTPGIVTYNLVLKHNYAKSSVVPVSDGAAYFDGTDDYIKIDSTVYDVDGSNLSFAWWGKIIDTSQICAAIGNEGNGAHQYIIVHSNGSIYVETDTNEDQINATLTSHDNEWHHYAFTTNGSGGGTFYQDGKNIGTSSSGLDDDMTIDTISNSESGPCWAGYLCNVAIWTRAITNAEIKSIMWKNYEGLTDSEKTNLVSWWNLSVNANDSHGSNNGTLS